MKKYFFPLAALIFFASAPFAHAAIAIDQTANPDAGGGSAPGTYTGLSWTNVNSGDIDCVMPIINSTGSVTAITDNGVAMTQVGVDQTAPGDNRINKLYCLANQAAGLHSFSVTQTGSFLRIAGASYSGGATSGQPEAQAQNTQNGGTTFSQSVTVTTANSWLIGIAESSGSNVAAGTGTTVRVTAGGNGAYAIVDSNGALAAGSQALAISGSTSFAMNVGSFKPPAPPQSGADTISIFGITGSFQGIQSTWQ